MTATSSIDCCVGAILMVPAGLNVVDPRPKTRQCITVGGDRLHAQLFWSVAGIDQRGCLHVHQFVDLPGHEMFLMTPNSVTFLG